MFDEMCYHCTNSHKANAICDDHYITYKKTSRDYLTLSEIVRAAYCPCGANIRATMLDHWATFATCALEEAARTE